MKVVNAPKNTITECNNPKVFLAGCVDNDWRKEFVRYFETDNVTFFDPKRNNWNFIDHKEQVKWEFRRLKESDIIVFCFNSKDVCPISLLEYGEWGLSRGTPLVVFIQKTYKKRFDLIEQTKLARPNQKIHDDWSEFILGLKVELDKWHKN